MLDRIKQTIKKYNMFARGDRVVVAVSGGADSISLLHILSCLAPELGIELHAVHVNHMLRGEAAQQDALFTANTCRRLGVPCTVREVDVRSLAKDMNTSKQDAARVLRYRVLMEESSKFRADKIALGHHGDDQAETVLLHLLRGTGLDGLAGMLPLRDNCYVRPLLEVSRQEIEAYCQEQGLDYCTDATNLEPVYLRNSIRLQLIPLLQRQYNPGLVKGLCQLAGLAREDSDFLRQAADRAFSEMAEMGAGSTVTIDLVSFATLHPAVRRRIIIRAWQAVSGQRVNLEFDQVESVMQLADFGRTGQGWLLPRGVWAEKSYNTLIVRQHTGHNVEGKQFSSLLPIPGRVELEQLGISISCELVAAVEKPDKNTVFLDAEKLVSPLIVRSRRDGDIFFPQGAPGRKKLKEFLIDAKIPRAMRDNIPLVCSGDQIVWVAGMRLADGFGSTPSAKSILRLRMEANPNKFNP
ncbi:MAG TPA: tRNA lysidine(34) synthetase TilS [Bacillota bacterium]|nr:tRNA lysidine(34) synthetase TilS [Bacillota bacterium]